MDNQFIYVGRILRVILFFASDEGCQSLPNSDAELLFPLAGAIVEYSGGDVSAVPRSVHCDAWTVKLNSVVAKAMERPNKSINGNLSSALKELTRVGWVHGPLGSSWTVGFGGHQTSGRLGFSQTFCLTYPEVLGIQENIKLNITPADLEHCRQIGLLMRKNILEARAAE